MGKFEVLQRIRECGVVPAVRVDTESQALRAIEALAKGGITVAEIAMSMPGAAQILAGAVARFGDSILIGAGTVLTSEAAYACISAGARYIVSPSLNLATIDICNRYGVAIFAGALTPTEIETAWSAGADCVKVFPVSSVGGVQYIKAIRAPLPQIELLPMGGVTLESVQDYLRAGSFALGVGNDLVSASACEIEQGAAISRRAMAYCEQVKAARQKQ